MKQTAQRRKNVTTVSERGMVSIPAAIRREFGIKKRTKIGWLALGSELRIAVLPDNIIESLQGCMKGTNMLVGLLEDRRRDRERE